MHLRNSREASETRAMGGFRNGPKVSVGKLLESMKRFWLLPKPDETNEEQLETAVQKIDS